MLEDEHVTEEPVTDEPVDVDPDAAIEAAEAEIRAAQAARLPEKYNPLEAVETFYRYENIDGVRLRVPQGPSRDAFIESFRAERNAKLEAEAKRQAELDAFAAMDPLERARAFPNDAERNALEAMLPQHGRRLL